MKEISFTKNEVRALGLLAVFGLLVPNGVFLYFLFSDSETVRAAMKNPVSLVFVAEAFFLMFLFAWLLAKAGIRRPSAGIFVVMSLIGSMVFSVPAALYLIFGRKREDAGAGSR